MKKNPKVTIIVPAYNEEKNIKELLDSLLNLDYENYKIILIVDKKTNDNTYKIARKISLENKNLKVIKNNKYGSAANRNRGYEESNKDTEYYAFTDGDCYVHKNWLKNLVDTLKISHQKVVGVGGINLTPDKDPKMSKLFTKIEQTLMGAGGTAQTKIVKKITKVNSIPNCNALYKKVVWRDNKQDETLIVGQDGEFNNRINNLGGIFLVNPKAVVWHRRPSTLKKQLERIYKYGEASSKILKKQTNKLKFIRKRWYGFITPVYFIVSIILLLLSLNNRIFLGIFLSGFIFYFFVIIISTLQVVFSHKKLDSLLTPGILFLQHLSYSFGILGGFRK